MKEDKIIFVDDYYIKRTRGMGRFVRCLTELSDRVSLLKSICFLPFPVWEQFFVYLRLLNLKRETIIFPYNTAPIFAHKLVDTVIVVHDLMFLNEKLCSWKYVTRPKSLFSFLYRRCVFFLVYKTAKSIIFVIENVEQEFLSRFEYAGTTYVLYNTIIPDLEKKLLVKERLNKEPLSDDIRFLCVTGLAPTKNLGFMLQGLSEYMLHSPSNRWTLNLIGITIKDFEANFSQLSEDLVERITVMENVADDRLADVYAESDFLLFPSLEEGFGVPLIEAMAANLGIICSKSSVMPTVCGNVAYYFDPTSTIDFKCMLTLATSKSASSKETRERYLHLFSNRSFKNRLENVLMC